MKEFYLTLPSNSSMGVFSNNTAAQYITKLSRTIELNDDKWEVGLVEIIFPLSFHNIRRGRNKFVFYENNIVIKDYATNRGEEEDDDAIELSTRYSSTTDSSFNN